MMYDYLKLIFRRESRLFHIHPELNNNVKQTKIIEYSLPKF